MTPNNSYTAIPLDDDLDYDEFLQLASSRKAELIDSLVARMHRTGMAAAGAAFEYYRLM